jgi:hypothetical protein
MASRRAATLIRVIAVIAGGRQPWCTFAAGNHLRLSQPR